MSFIKDRIFLGSEENALNASFLKKNNIKYILEVNDITEDYKIPFYKKLGIEYKFLPYSDDGKDYAKHPRMIPTVMKKSYEILQDFDKKSALVGGNILVHCMLGKSRSNSVVINYFILKDKSTYERVYPMVKKQRRQVWTLWEKTVEYLKSKSYY